MKEVERGQHGKLVDKYILGLYQENCGRSVPTEPQFVWFWINILILRGKGDYYRLGHGSDDHVRRPKRVAALQNKKVVAIATGSLHCVACTDTGEVYTWGDNDEGQLGDGSTNAIQRPRLVTALQVSRL